MKKHLKLLAVVLCLLPLLGFGQNNVKVEISAPYEVIDAKEKYYLKKGDFAIAIKVDGKEISIQKLDLKTMSIIKANIFKDMPENYVLEKLMLYNNRTYLFYSLWNKEAKQEQLFYREIDFDKAEFYGTDKLMFTEDGKISGTLTNAGFYNLSVTDKFDFFTSYDNTKLLVQYRMKPEERRDALNKDLIGLRVFGPNMETVWGNVIQMPYTEKKMNNLDYSVDSDGNAYILTTVFNDNTTDDKKKGDDEANYHIELIRVKATNQVLENSTVVVEDKFINAMWLYEGPNNLMFCAGFYNNGTRSGNADGVCMFKINRDGKIFDVKSYEIPLEVINQYSSLRTQKKNEKKDEDGKAEFENLELKEIFFEDDGSIILVGEQHYITTRTTYSSSGSRTTYIYHFNHILVTKINANSKIAWMRKIPKIQTASRSYYQTRFKGGMSYTMVKGKDGYNFLYLDNAKNLDLSADQNPAGHTDGMGGYLTSFNINSKTGETKKTPVFDLRNVEGLQLYQFAVDRILPTSDDEFVVEAYKKKKEDVMVRVKLK